MTRRFDTVAKQFASRNTRRAALAHGVAGLAAASLAPGSVARDGTPTVATPAADPDDPHPSADSARPDPEFLFVQPFEDGTYTLTLAGAAAQTVYFSDRPERVVGLAPTQDFLDGLGFTPANPPNAALVALTEDGEQEVLVIELLNPVYDPNDGTLTYNARVLADYAEPGLTHLARQQTDYELSESFGAGSLFIDGCSDGYATCYQQINNEPVSVGELYDLACCWQAASAGCAPCDQDPWAERYGRVCAEAFPDTCHYYSGGVNGWDCFASDLFCTG